MKAFISTSISDTPCNCNILSKGKLALNSSLSSLKFMCSEAQVTPKGKRRNTCRKLCNLPDPFSQISIVTETNKFYGTPFLRLYENL